MTNHLDFAFEVKALDEAGKFSGLASTYGNVDHVGDIVDHGAFSADLATKGTERPILWQHDARQPIGLGVLKDTAAGLEITGALDMDVQAGREAHSRLKKRIVRGLSIGFRTLKDNMVDHIRHLQQIELFEVSLVTFPANERATVTAVKSSIQGIRDFEKWLHEAGGFSRSEAKRLASHGFRGLGMPDDPEPDPAADEVLGWLREQRAAIGRRAA